MATKRPRSPKQLANDERLRQLAAERRAKTEATADKPTLNPGLGNEPQESIVSPELDELKAQIAEFKQNQALLMQLIANKNPNSAGNPSFNREGGLVGSVEKYIVDPKNYPDPSQRLLDEQRLQRFAVKDNYELNYEVSTTSYQTKDGINMKEPRFKLELIRIIYDEDTGERTTGRYVVCRAFFHEDPQAAIVVARDNGIEVDESNEKAFLDEMRYYRMRDWLMEAFYPPKVQVTKNKREMVVGNKLVEYFEVNSEDSETIPFGQLKNKV